MDAVSYTLYVICLLWCLVFFGQGTVYFYSK